MMQLRRGDLGHPQLIAIFLIASSVLGIANFAVYPVFSQNYQTTVSFSLGSNTTGYNRTVTVIQTYQTTGFTTSSSMFTQIMVAFVTSTTFFTYVEVTFTSSTSTVAYPAPSARPKPSSEPLQVKAFSASTPTRLTEYGGSSSLLVVVLIIVFGLLRRKTGNVDGAERENRGHLLGVSAVHNGKDQA
jgi:hypothetical protein